MFNDNEFKIIPSVRKLKDLEYSLKLNNTYVLLSDVHIGNLKTLVEKCHAAHKKVIVNMDLIGGLALDKVGISMLKNMYKVDIIIGSNVAKINMAKNFGMKVIHRIILMDSKSFDSAMKSLLLSKADAVEVIPSYYGIKFAENIKECKKIPLILGGFIDNSEIIKEAIKHGFHGASTSNRNLWHIEIKTK